MISESQEKYLQGTLDKARSLLQLGRYDLALQDLEEVYPWRPAAVGPLYAEALMQRGKQCEEKGDRSKALADYQRASGMPITLPLKTQLQEAISRVEDGQRASPLRIAEYDLPPQFTFQKPAVDQAVLKQPAVLYKDTNDQSAPIAQLKLGDQVKLGGTRKKGKDQWVEITLPDGRKGYLPGTSQVFRTIKVKLIQGDTNVLAEPSINSAIKFKVATNEKFYILDSSDGWVKIRTRNGNEGYLDGRVSVKKLAAVSKEIARRNMVGGALWCIGGGLVTCVSYSAASSSGGTYLITWGAILFGAIQFMQGLSQYREASDG